LTRGTNVGQKICLSTDLSNHRSSVAKLDNQLVEGWGWSGKPGIDFVNPGNKGIPTEELKAQYNDHVVQIGCF
jgi:hypothetical protein